MGFWSTLGTIGGAIAAPFTGGASLIPSLIGAGAAGLAGAASSSANNRGEKFGGQNELQQLLMARDQQAFNNSISREQEGRAQSSDALKKLLSTSHTLNPGGYTHLSPYSVAPRQASDAEMTGAQALQAEALKRIQGGNSIQPFQQSPLVVDPNLLNASGFEKFAGIAAPAMGVWSALAQQKPPLPSTRIDPRYAMYGPANIGSGNLNG